MRVMLKVAWTNMISYRYKMRRCNVVWTFPLDGVSSSVLTSVSYLWTWWYVLCVWAECGRGFLVFWRFTCSSRFHVSLVKIVGYHRDWTPYDSCIERARVLCRVVLIFIWSAHVDETMFNVNIACKMYTPYTHPNADEHTLTHMYICTYARSASKHMHAHTRTHTHNNNNYWDVKLTVLQILYKRGKTW